MQPFGPKNCKRTIDQPTVGFDLLKYSASSNGGTSRGLTFPTLVSGYRFIKTHPIPTHPLYFLRTHYQHPNGSDLEFFHGRTWDAQRWGVPIWQAQFRSGIYVLLDTDLPTVVKAVRAIEDQFTVSLKLSGVEIPFDFPTSDPKLLRDYFKFARTRTKKGRYNDTPKIEWGFSRGRIEVRLGSQTLFRLRIRTIEDLTNFAYSHHLFRYYLRWEQGPAGWDRTLMRSRMKGADRVSKSIKRKHRRRLRPHPIQHMMEEAVTRFQNGMRLTV